MLLFNVLWPRSLAAVWAVFVISLVFEFRQTLADTPVAQKKLRVYVVQSLTGPNAFEGNRFVDVARLFVEQQNKKGGLLGRRLELLSLNDEGSASIAGKHAETALADPEHFMTYGSPFSRIALPVARLYAKKKALYFTPSATHKEISTLGPSIFQLAYNDDFQGRVLANFAKEQFSPRRVLVVTSRSDPYSEGLSDSFIKQLGSIKLPGLEIKQFNFIRQRLNAQELLELVRQFKPDLYFVPLLREEAAEVLEIISSTFTETPPQVLGSDGWGVQAEIEQYIQRSMPDKPEVKYFYTFFWDPAVDTAANRTILSQLKASFSDNPLYVAGVLGLEGFNFVKQAVEETQSVDSLTVANFLRSRSWASSTGNLVFTKEGPTQRPIVILEISKQGIKFHSVVNPGP